MPPNLQHGLGQFLDAVKKIIENYQKKYNRNIYFIDKKGNIKLHSSTFPEKIKNISEIEGLSDLADEIISGNKTSFQYENKARTIHLLTRYISHFDWYLFVEQTEEKVTRRILNALFLNLTICFFVIMIVLFLLNMIIDAYQKRIDTMRGIVPICSYCKNIRDDKGYWGQVEAYVEKYTDAKFSHGCCPDCLEKYFPEYKSKIKL